jgi:tRNA pseudouridine55 synthase
VSDNQYYVNKEESRANCGVQELFLHPRLILPEFPAVAAPPEALVKIRHGGSANLPEFGKAPMVRVFEGQAKLICLARRVAGTLFQPKIVLL